MDNEVKLIGTLAGAGVLIGLAKMLVSDEPLKVRQVIGRAILSGALGVAAGAAVIFVPGLSFVAQVSLACALASLGTSALEALFKRAVSK